VRGLGKLSCLFPLGCDWNDRALVSRTSRRIDRERLFTFFMFATVSLCFHMETGLTGDLTTSYSSDCDSSFGSNLARIPFFHPNHSRCSLPPSFANLSSNSAVGAVSNSPLTPEFPVCRVQPTSVFPVAAAVTAVSDVRLHIRTARGDAEMARAGAKAGRGGQKSGGREAKARVNNVQATQKLGKLHSIC
jgi:hypothetical protein